MDAEPVESPTDKDRENANGCGILNQWDRLDQSNRRADLMQEVCASCPRNTLLKPTALYVKGCELLRDLDMGFALKPEDRPAAVTEAARIIRAERDRLREEDRNGNNR